MYSSRRYPRLYLFSSAQTCPSWTIPERVLEYLHRRKQRAVNAQIGNSSSSDHQSEVDEKLQCCYGDGPGRYMHPTLQKPYCSIACYKRLEEERMKSQFVIELNADDLKSIQKPERSVAVKREMTASQRMGVNYPTTSPFSSSTPMNGNYPPPPSTTASPASPFATTAKQPSTVANRSHPYPNSNNPNNNNNNKIPSTTNTNGSTGMGLANPNTTSSTSSTSSTSNSLLMPSIITTTTPNGQIVRYQLHHDKSVLISSKSITITIQPNQIYYLQSEMNGRVIATPHLLGGTVIRNNILHYCMIPMVVIPSTVTTIPAKSDDPTPNQESGPK